LQKRLTRGSSPIAFAEMREIANLAKLNEKYVYCLSQVRQKLKHIFEFCGKRRAITTVTKLHQARSRLEYWRTVDDARDVKMNDVYGELEYTSGFERLSDNLPALKKSDLAAGWLFLKGEDNKLSAGFKMIGFETKRRLKRGNQDCDSHHGTIIIPSVSLLIIFRRTRGSKMKGKNA